MTNLPEEFLPVFHHMISAGQHRDRVLVGWAHPGQQVHDVLVHLTVPHAVTPRPHVTQEADTGYYDLWEQQIGRVVKEPIARTVFDWDSKTYPDGVSAMEGRTKLIQSMVDRQARAVATIDAELSAVGVPSRSSVLHPGAPAAKPWGVKDPAPEEEVYDVLRTFMLGKKIRILVCGRTTEAPLYEYVGTLANYVLGYAAHDGKTSFVTFRFTLMGDNEDISLDMKAYSLEIELISGS